MAKLKILVSGANGQLGQELQWLSQNEAHADWHFTNKSMLDITDEKTVQHRIESIQPDYFINAAAYTAVDLAESNEGLATLINGQSLGWIAQACHQNNTTLFQISTDYVYHGSQNLAYQETDPTYPQSVYAQSKKLGEELALTNCPNTFVIRTSWLYSSFGKNFVKTMIRLGTERPNLNVVNDQIGTPTYARDLANFIWQIIQKRANKGSVEPGIYNFSNEGIASWYDFAHAIFEYKEIDCILSPIPTSEFPTPAVRPPFSLMDKNKARNIVGPINHWRNALQKMLQATKNQ